MKVDVIKSVRGKCAITGKILTFPKGATGVEVNDEGLAKALVDAGFFKPVTVKDAVLGALLGGKEKGEEKAPEGEGKEPEKGEEKAPEGEGKEPKGKAGKKDASK